ncbi:MAG: PIN domain-containing protein [bacterium]
MIKDGVIVDTSILIDFLKGSDAFERDVNLLIEKNRLITTGVIIAELLQGVKNPKEEQRIAGLLTAINLLEITTDLWIKAGMASSALRRKGINLPLTDVAIATLAMEHNLSVLTLDKHFKQIPGLKIYKESESIGT